MPWFFKTAQKILHSNRPPYYLQDHYPIYDGVQLSSKSSIWKLLDHVQERAKVLINDNRVFNSTDLLEYRRIQTSRRAHPFVVDCAVNRTIHYRENSILTALLAYGMIFQREVFPIGYDIDKFKSSVHKQYSLFPPYYKLFS